MKINETLDHPCKGTCSGWQQGYDRGISHFKNSQNEVIKRINDLVKENDDYRKFMEAMAVSCCAANDARRLLARYSKDMQ